MVKGGNMKNIYILLLLCTIPCITHAADTMCVKPTTTVVVLDPNIAGTSNGSSATGKPWSTEFSYGIISGVAACYSFLNGVTRGMAPTDQSMTPYTTGGYCYCKMLRPVESNWVNAGGTNNSGYLANCATACPEYCATQVGSNLTLRSGIFNNVLM